MLFTPQISYKQQRFSKAFLMDAITIMKTAFNGFVNINNYVN